MAVSRPAPADQAAGPTVGERRSPRWRRWVLLALLLAFFGIVMIEVIDPFGGQSYVPISHGDHVHYVPEDRDPDVSISAFPQQPPGPDERILPDGRVVPK